MPLLIEARLEELGVRRPEGAASISLGFIITPRVLSRPYSLTEGDELVGRIVELYELREGLPSSDEALKELWGTEIRLVLKPLLSGDYLFLSETTWKILRDYGVVVPGNYVFRLEIHKAIRKSGKEVEIYPKRVVKV